MESHNRLLDVSIILLLAICNCAFCLPAGNFDLFGKDLEDAGTQVSVRLPLTKSSRPIFSGRGSHFFNDDAYEDDGDDDSFPFSSGNFPKTYFKNPFGNVFKELREDMKNLERELEELANQTGNGNSVIFSGTGLTITGNFDPSKYENKTTSRIEVINGQRVQINETTYTEGDKTNGRVLHVKTTHVLPSNNPEYSPEKSPNDSKNPEEPDRSDIKPKLPPARPDQSDDKLSPQTPILSGETQHGNRKKDREDMDNEINNRRVSNLNDLNA